MKRGHLALLAVLSLVVLSGCTLPSSPDQFDTDRELGAVGDYHHDDVFEFDGSEGLSERELEAVKYRSMARIEVIRDLKFKHDVELEVISRDEYRSQRGEPRAASPFVNEVWRGAFVVDGETDVNRAMNDLYGGAVQGYYTNDRIVIITDDTDRVRINRDTLVHELVHALQDQHFGLERRGQTIDAQRAEIGLTEGEAEYIPYLYDQRCESEWQCLVDDDRPPLESDAGARSFNVGLFLSIYTPYSEGPPFVASLHESSGWTAVDRAHGDRPASTSQLIHPERYPDDRPVNVEVPDRSSDDWEPVMHNREPRTETIGEATLFASLWSNGVIDRSITEGATDLSPYNYSHPVTDGWTGDTFRVYQDAGDGDRTGHVWKLAWENEADAKVFADAYRSLLESRGAESVSDSGGVYRIPDGTPFEGAYRVTVTDETVELVGAPAVGDLEGIHALETASLEQPRTLEQPATPASLSTTATPATAFAGG